MLNHVDLCSGIGGFSLGFEWAGLSRPILFCDIEPWSRQILKKHWPDVPIAEDVKEIAADPDRFISGRVDILTAGYPCQPFSVAGKQRGTEDPRHIYPYISRIVAHKRPTWCIFENVYGHVSLGLDEVLHDLESQGYSIRPFIVPASAVNAPHKRDRLWIIARVGNTKHDGSSASKIEGSNRKDAERTSEGSIKTKQSEGTSRSRNDEAMADTDNNGLERGFSETRNEDASGENSQSVRSTNTDNSFRQSNDGRNKKESRVDGVVSGSSDGGAASPTRATRVCGVSETEHNHKGVGIQDRYQKNNDRALVQEGQSRVQSSEHRGLGKDQATFENNQVRSGDDNNSEQGMDNKREAMAYTDSRRCKEREAEPKEISRSISGSTDVAYTNGNGSEAGLSGQNKGQEGFTEEPIDRDHRLRGRPSEDFWAVEPPVGRVAHGIPRRVDRLKGLGNAIVPQIAQKIGETILKLESFNEKKNKD